ncbi:hypothetical protein [Desulfovibrio sp. JC022]|uniref:hypothetical protein n=1 Tax=Desulfovibrio sp. JC022 TaxID=2593642 RepID=UPI0013D8DDA0|nr:hypothetical protein [Desulfovibrio sp. JC022]NDV24113.1 hypothetical protein [Desulfovibrio sp. JC022]
MARPFIAPDPNDRSVNEPSVVVSANQVLGYYNQENKDNKRERVVDSVKSWYMDKMEEAGWSEAKFTGSQCVLGANIKLEK